MTRGGSVLGPAPPPIRNSGRRQRATDPARSLPVASQQVTEEDEMPELDGTQIVAIAAFAVLVLSWIFAPTRSVVAAESELSAAA